MSDKKKKIQDILYRMYNETQEESSDIKKKEAVNADGQEVASVTTADGKVVASHMNAEVQGTEEGKKIQKELGIKDAAKPSVEGMVSDMEEKGDKVPMPEKAKLLGKSEDQKTKHLQGLRDSLAKLKQMQSGDKPKSRRQQIIDSAKQFSNPSPETSPKKRGHLSLIKSLLAKKQGVPEGVSPSKQERCVQDVKKKGHDKVSAIKICNASLQKGEEHPHDSGSEMQRRQLKELLHHIQEAASSMGDKDLPDWLESKIAEASKTMSEVAHYLEHEKTEGMAKSKKKDDKPFKGYNKKKHARTGGLNEKARKKYNRENNANLKAPVTGKPKAGSKDAKRKKSFCARMSGVKGPTSKDGKLTPKGAALKRWNCSKSLEKSYHGLSNAGATMLKSMLAKRCWEGYKPVPGKKPYSKGSCVKKSEMRAADMRSENLQKSHSQKVREIADAYARKKGFQIKHGKDENPLDENRGKHIANAFESMEHNPSHPEVQKAYNALINETKDQFEHILKHSGLKVSKITPDMENPYKTGSKALFEDIDKNNHMWYFPTESGFGSDDSYSDHPLMQNVKLSNGQEMPANDMFRIVHDYFGHAKEGVGFGPKGEEHAWRAHMPMYSPDAQKALTTETRGQNSWVNFGPHGESNRADPANTKYADQKAGLLPDWATSMKPFEKPEEDKMAMSERNYGGRCHPHRHEMRVADIMADSLEKGAVDARKIEAGEKPDFELQPEHHIKLSKQYAELARRATKQGEHAKAKFYISQSKKHRESY